MKKNEKREGCGGGREEGVEKDGHFRYIFTLVLLLLHKTSTFIVSNYFGGEMSGLVKERCSVRTGQGEAQCQDWSGRGTMSGLVRERHNVGTGQGEAQCQDW